MAVLTVTAAYAMAQPAAERLKSAEPSELAWGAYLAAEGQQKELIPSILPLLKHANSGVRLAAVDALIRLDADAREEDLTELLDGYWLDSALILLARNPTKHAVFLATLLDHPLDLRQWNAINDILMSTPTPGYTALLWKDLSLKLRVAVIGSSSVGGIADGIPSPPSFAPPIELVGFPPQFLYVIADSTQGNGLFTLVEHPKVVKYRRMPYQPAYYVWSEPDLSGEARRQLRWNCLAMLAGLDPSDLGSKIPDQTQYFRWNGPQKFRSDAANLLATIRARIAAIRQGLISRGLLTQEESRIGPKLDVEVDDQRFDRGVSIPPIDWRLDPPQAPKK